MKTKSKTNLKARLLTILAIFTLGLTWVAINNTNTNNVYAEKGTAGIFVSPMTQKMILTPGETYVNTIVISNGKDSAVEVSYEAKIGSYSPVGNTDSKDNYGGVNVNDITNYNTIMNWITLEKDNGIIAPSEKDVLTYTIKVPKDAPAGAQYASILISEKDKDDDNLQENGSGGVIKSKFQLASAILANVAGETVEKGSIKSNEMPTMLTTNKLEATSMVRNDGNIYTDASYTLQVWPMGSDEEICTNEEKAESTTVLPDTERYHVQTCDLPSVGIFKAKQVVKIFSEESVLEKTIFVCPIWLMVLVLIVVVGIVVGIIIYIKKRHSAKED